MLQEALVIFAMDLIPHLYFW